MLYQTQPNRKSTGQIDGGWLAGPGDEARAADVVLEDWVGPPLYSIKDRRSAYRVESTHTQTTLTGTREDGMHFKVFTFEHPNGLI